MQGVDCIAATANHKTAKFKCKAAKIASGVPRRDHVVHPDLTECID